MKPAVIVAICLIIVGIAIIFVAMFMSDFSFEKMGTENYEKVTYPIDGVFENILVSTQIHNIYLTLAPDGVCKVIGDESENIKIKVECDGKNLKIETEDDRKWYHYIGIALGKPSITIYLPESAYTSLTVASDTGHINIPKDFKFLSSSLATSTGETVFLAKVKEELALASNTGNITASGQTLSRLDIQTDTGKILLESIKADEYAKIRASTGKIELYEIKCKKLDAETTTGAITLKNILVEYDLNINASTGKLTLTNCISASMMIETSTGDIDLIACDAESIDIETNTGDVEGTLLTAKIFDTDTDTGKIRVPQSTEGGTCKIRTDTGDIIITIE